MECVRTLETFTTLILATVSNWEPGGCIVQYYLCPTYGLTVKDIPCKLSSVDSLIKWLVGTSYFTLQHKLFKDHRSLRDWDAFFKVSIFILYDNFRWSEMHNLGRTSCLDTPFSSNMVSEVWSGQLIVCVNVGWRNCPVACHGRDNSKDTKILRMIINTNRISY